MEPSSLAAVAGDGVAIREAAAAREQAAAAGGGRREAADGEELGEMVEGISRAQQVTARGDDKF